MSGVCAAPGQLDMTSRNVSIKRRCDVCQYDESLGASAYWERIEPEVFAENIITFHHVFWYTVCFIFYIVFSYYISNRYVLSCRMYRLASS